MLKSTNHEKAVHIQGLKLMSTIYKLCKLRTMLASPYTKYAICLDTTYYHDPCTQVQRVIVYCRKVHTYFVIPRPIQSAIAVDSLCYDKYCMVILSGAFFIST